MKNVGIVGFQEQKFLLNVLIVKQEVGMEKLKEIKMISKAILFDPQFLQELEEGCKNSNQTFNNFIIISLEASFKLKNKLEEQDNREKK